MRLAFLVLECFRTLSNRLFPQEPSRPVADTVPPQWPAVAWPPLLQRTSDSLVARLPLQPMGHGTAGAPLRQGGPVSAPLAARPVLPPAGSDSSGVGAQLLNGGAVASVGTASVGAAANADDVAATAACASDNLIEEASAPAQPATELSTGELLIAQRTSECNDTDAVGAGRGGAGALPLHDGPAFDSLAARRVLQPMELGTGSSIASSLHAGAVFDSLEGFKQAMQKEQEHFKSEAVLHRLDLKPNKCAYVCRDTYQAILTEGISCAKDGKGAQEWQWYQLVCAGACGFVTEVQQATGWKSNTAAARAVMQPHILDSPLCEVGADGVRQDQWVVTMYAPHTCTPAAPAATPASLAPAAPAPAALADPFLASAAATPAAPAAPATATATSAALAAAAAAPAAALATPAASRASGRGCSSTDCEPARHCASIGRTTLQPVGSRTDGAQPLHAGAVFDSLDDFKQAVMLDQLRESNIVIHKNRGMSTHGAFICRATNQAMQREGIAASRDDLGATDRQWWRHVCAGACSFIAQVQPARGQSKTTMLSTVMHAHIRDNPMTAAPNKVGVSGVQRGQWVVTLYMPHTCTADAAAPAVVHATPAAVAGTDDAFAALVPLSAPAPPPLRTLALSWHSRCPKRRCWMSLLQQVAAAHVLSGQARGRATAMPATVAVRRRLHSPQTAAHPSCAIPLAMLRRPPPSLQRPKSMTRARAKKRMRRLSQSPSGSC